MLGERADLGGRVDGAALGGLRDRDGARLGAVLVADTRDRPVHELRRQLAVGRAHRDQLGAEQALGGAALVDGDVRGLRADHVLPRVQGEPEADEVGAGAVEDERDLGVPAEVRPHRRDRAVGDGVGPVRGRVSGVGIGDRRQHLGVHAAVVVAAEAVHHRDASRARGVPRRHAGWAATAASAPPAIRRPAPSIAAPGTACIDEQPGHRGAARSARRVRRREPGLRLGQPRPRRLGVDQVARDDDRGCDRQSGHEQQRRQHPERRGPDGALETAEQHSGGEQPGRGRREEHRKAAGARAGASAASRTRGRPTVLPPATQAKSRPTRDWSCSASPSGGRDGQVDVGEAAADDEHGEHDREHTQVRDRRPRAPLAVRVRLGSPRADGVRPGVGQAADGEQSGGHEQRDDARARTAARRPAAGRPRRRTRSRPRRGRRRRAGRLPRAGRCARRRASPRRSGASRVPSRRRARRGPRRERRLTVAAASAARSPPRRGR